MGLKTVFSLILSAATLAFLGWAAFQSVTEAQIGRASWVDKDLWDELTRYLEAKEARFKLGGVGCCLDSVVRAKWEPQEIDLELSNSNGNALKILVPPTARQLVLDQGLNSFASSHGHLWVVDHSRGRFVDHFADASFTVLPGSEDLGSAQALIATPFRYRLKDQTGDPQDGDRLLLTSHSRLQQAAYAVSPTQPAIGAAATAVGYVVQSPPHDARSLAEYRPDHSEIRPVLAGLELYAPTGIALSPGGDRLYVADERPSELVWLELRLDDFCSDKWSYQGVLARFPLKSSDRGLFRGLLVHSSGMLIGSAPGGLFFYTADGKQVGKILTPDEITYLLPGLYSADKRTQAECIYAAIGSRLCYLPIKAMAIKALAPTPLCQPSRRVPRPKLPKSLTAPAPIPKCCCCNGTGESVIQ